jgi:thymidine phosphorylase
MRIVDVIARKRDGQALSREAIEFFVNGVAAGTVPDYQASALLMAIVLRGMTPEETAWLTQAAGDGALRGTCRPLGHPRRQGRQAQHWRRR